MAGKLAREIARTKRMSPRERILTSLRLGQEGLNLMKLVRNGRAAAGKTPAR
jgi:hypothetical protein